MKLKPCPGCKSEPEFDSVNDSVSCPKLSTDCDPNGCPWGQTAYDVEFWQSLVRDDESQAEPTELSPETMFPSIAVRREIGTGLAKTAVYRCKQRGSDNYLTNLNVMLFGMIDICTQMVRQLVASGAQDQAMAVEGKCRVWVTEAREMESVMQSMETESRIITPDEPRLIGLDGEAIQ